MKKSIRNIIMIVIIILMGGMIFLTMDYAKDHLVRANSNQMGMSAPPGMTNNIQGDKNNTDSGTDNLEKPGGDNNQGEAPAKPDDDNNQSDSDSNMNQDSSRQMPGDGNNMPSMSNQANTSKLTTVYCVVFGIESLILVLTLVYLVMSNFNKKKFKETFTNKDKIIIYVLLTIILTSGFTYGEKVITEKYFLTNTDTNEKMPSGTNSITYSANKEITQDETITSGEYTSTNEDWNAILVSGDVEANISNITVSKEGDSDGGEIIPVFMGPTQLF